MLIMGYFVLKAYAGAFNPLIPAQAFMLNAMPIAIRNMPIVEMLYRFIIMVANVIINCYIPIFDTWVWEKRVPRPL